jgi:hypothetical protein
MHRFTAMNHGSHDMAGKAKYFSHAASKYHNKSGKNSSTLPVIFLVSFTCDFWYPLRFMFESTAGFNALGPCQSSLLDRCNTLLSG